MRWWDSEAEGSREGWSGGGSWEAPSSGAIVPSLDMAAAASPKRDRAGVPGEEETQGSSVLSLTLRWMEEAAY